VGGAILALDDSQSVIAAASAVTVSTAYRGASWRQLRGARKQDRPRGALAAAGRGQIRRGFGDRCWERVSVLDGCPDHQSAIGVYLIVQIVVAEWTHSSSHR
jgi:hypothetical protein